MYFALLDVVSVLLNSIKNMDTQIKKYLEERIYFFSINVVSFLKTIEKIGYKNNQTKEVPQLSELTTNLSQNTLQLNSLFFDILDNKVNISEIEKCLSLSENCLKTLQKIDIDDKVIINEQADLQIDMSGIIKKLKKII